MNRFPGPTVMIGNYLCQVVPAGREIKLLVSSSSRARNCEKTHFPLKFHEILSCRNEISRRIQWKPPQGPEIDQKSIFYDLDLLIQSELYHNYRNNTDTRGYRDQTPRGPGRKIYLLLDPPGGGPGPPRGKKIRKNRNKHISIKKTPQNRKSKFQK